jgi:hypothetical protein
MTKFGDEDENSMNALQVFEPDAPTVYTIEMVSQFAGCRQSAWGKVLGEDRHPRRLRQEQLLPAQPWSSLRSYALAPSQASRVDLLPRVRKLGPSILRPRVPQTLTQLSLLGANFGNFSGFATREAAKVRVVKTYSLHGLENFVLEDV